MSTVTLEDWNNQTASTVSTADLDAAVKAMLDKKEEVDQVAKLKKSLTEQYEKLESTVMEMLQSAGKQKYFVEGYGTASIVARTSVSFPKDHASKQKFFTYLREKGGSGLLYEMTTVNYQSLNSYYKQELEALPEEDRSGFKLPGIPEPTAQQYLRFTKERNK